MTFLEVAVPLRCEAPFGKRSIVRYAWFSLGFLAVAGPLPAQGITRFKEEYLAELEGPTRQVLALADAMPKEKYTWRPGQGVRSVSEVFVHIAAGNFLLLDVLGAKPRRDLYPGIEATQADRAKAILQRNQQLEKTVTEKQRVAGLLQKSLDAVKEAFTAASEADLERPVKFFGRETTARAVYLRILAHLNEHMGQSVAYARLNGVVPPWSQPEKNGK